MSCRIAALEAERSSLQEALAASSASAAPAEHAAEPAVDEAALTEALAVAEAAEAQLAERTQQAQQLEQQLVEVAARLQVGVYALSCCTPTAEFSSAPACCTCASQADAGRLKGV